MWGCLRFQRRPWSFSLTTFFLRQNHCFLCLQQHRCPYLQTPSLRNLPLSPATSEHRFYQVRISTYHHSFPCFSSLILITKLIGGDFSVTLKNPTNNPSRIFSFSEFCITFSQYTEIICAAFPYRRHELNDYLTILAELALSYGSSHFYTYHKLFSAKCAVRIAQWNQCPY